MESQKILIVSQVVDPHVDAIIRNLNSRSAEVVRLNTEEIPIFTPFSFEFSDRQSCNWNIEITPNGRKVDSENIKSIWWRRPSLYGFPDDFSTQERIFAKGETDHVLSSFWATVECFWMSNPENIRQASWKGEQLKRANAFGFDTPRTIITCDPGVARDFYKANRNKIVFKAMSDPFLGAGKLVEQNPTAEPELLALGTKIINEVDEYDGFESVKFVPCLFQAYVEKKKEYRVTIVGDKVFIAEIDSQADERTLTDWRIAQLEVPMNAVKLPKDVEERCLSFVKSYGLSYSALDLILTPDDRYIFLENNPNGQFLFVDERLPELGIADAIAERLIQGNTLI